MGYTSSVKSVIYGDPDRMKALVMKFKHVDTFDLWSTSGDAFGHDIREYEAVVQVGTHTKGADAEGRKRLRFIVIEGDWKWYEDYSSVKAWQRFLDMAEEMGLCTEFVRVGEDRDDIEHLWFGDETLNLLDVSVSITSDIPDPEPEPTQ